MGAAGLPAQISIPAPGIINTLAGNGTAGYSGDGGSSTSAEVWYATSVALDGSGNIYIADEDNCRIRKITASTGIITTVAGNGDAPGYGSEVVCGSTGDGGAATSAEIAVVGGLAVDAAGNIYFAQNNNTVRKVTAATGIITTIAGTGVGYYSGDGGAATSADLWGPSAVAVDASGNVYIADTLSYRVRKITASTGIITTVAGNGTLGYAGDNGAATSAGILEPQGLVVDSSGNLYISTYSYVTNPRTGVVVSHSAVRKVAAGTGIITTVAGNETSGFSGDGGSATSAELNSPFALAVDASGNLYIADSINQAIRKVTAAGIISTVAGGGQTLGDGGAATSANLDWPNGVAVDAAGDLYTADTYGERIRIVGGPKVTPTVLVACSPNPITYGGSNSVCTISVGGGATGTVSLTYNGTAWATLTLASGVTTATWSSTFGVGTYTIAATYNGDGHHNTASGSTNLVVNKASPGIALSSSVNPLPYEALSVYTATVSGGQSPTGNVAFEINGTTFGTVALSSGKAVYNGTNEVWAPGTYTISAVYAGDAYNNSATATLSQTVSKPTVTTVVGGTTVVEGSSITLQGNGFGSTQGSSTVTISGIAATVTSWSSTSITVTVPVGSSSGNGQLIVTVNGYASAPLPLALKIPVTITILSVSPTTPTVTYGQPVTVNVEVNTSTSAIPTGSATCTATGTPTVSSTQTVLAGTNDATASLILNDIPVGTQTITCTFAGTGKYNNSTGAAPTAKVTVVQGLDTPTAKVVSSSSTSAYGDYVTFTATITGVSGSPVPTGTVTFLDGGATLATVTLTPGTSSATAVFGTAALSVSSHSITVEYSGDAYYSSVTSAAITQTVTNQSGACIP